MRLKGLAAVLCVALAFTLVGCPAGGGPLDVCKQYVAAEQAENAMGLWGLVTADMQKNMLESMAGFAAFGADDDAKQESLNKAIAAWDVKWEPGEDVWEAAMTFSEACAAVDDKKGLFGAIVAWAQANKETETDEAEAGEKPEKGPVVWGTPTTTETTAKVSYTQKVGDNETTRTFGLTKVEGKWLIADIEMSMGDDHDHDDDDTDGDRDGEAAGNNG